MTANTVLSQEQFNNELENSLTVIENLTEKENIQSEKYTYYKCEYITPGLYRRIIIVAVYK
jgi:hypothetical protein